MNQATIHIWKRRLAGAAVLAAAGFGLTCASTPSPGDPSPSGTAEPPPRDVRERERAAAAVYRRAEDAFEAANYVAAESLSSGLVSEYDDTRWLGPGLLLSAQSLLELNQLEDARGRAGRYLRLYRAADPERAPGLVLVARTLYVEGSTVEAADTLLATPSNLGDERETAAQLARQVVSELGIGEIEAVSARWPAYHPLQSVFEVELASLLMVAGHSDSARAAAAGVLELNPLEPERDRAQAIESGDIQDEQWRPIIGAILPLSGTLARYGRAAEEGIRLAVEEYNRRHYDR